MQDGDEVEEFKAYGLHMYTVMIALIEKHKRNGAIHEMMIFRKNYDQWEKVVPYIIEHLCDYSRDRFGARVQWQLYKGNDLSKLTTEERRVYSAIEWTRIRLSIALDEPSILMFENERKDYFRQHEEFDRMQTELGKDLTFHFHR